VTQVEIVSRFDGTTPVAKWIVPQELSVQLAMEFPAKWSGFWILWFLFANATVHDCEKTKGYLQGNLNLFRGKKKQLRVGISVRPPSKRFVRARET
jgi:hypothetical protein